MNTVEAVVKRINDDYPEKALRDVAIAFVDCLGIDYKIASQIRNLDFRGEYTDKDTFLKQVEIVGSYNVFDLDIAKRIVDSMTDSTQYRLAREGSVAVYIRTDELNAKEIAEEFDADESSFSNGELRLWWD